MPHIDLPKDAPPGIVGLMAFRPDTGRILQELAETLLRSESTLSRGERELIAGAVSKGNACAFCAGSHAAFAAAQLEGGAARVAAVLADPAGSDVGDKMRALLAIAEEVRRGGREVTAASVARAKAAGASDREVHDAVLIAAAFSMFNRYVDGLGTIAPPDPRAYDEMAKVIVAQGYVRGPATAARG